jgi:hypothetical protein
MGAVIYAKELEAALYELFPFLSELGSNAAQLKKEYRSRYLSLKGNLPRNTPLVESIITGERTCKDVCRMSVHELAAPEVQVKDCRAHGSTEQHSAVEARERGRGF